MSHLRKRIETINIDKVHHISKIYFRSEPVSQSHTASDRQRLQLAESIGRFEK